MKRRKQRLAKKSSLYLYNYTSQVYSWADDSNKFRTREEIQYI